MKRNILILYTNYGTGHYMAAKAIEEYINNNYSNYNVSVLDPLTFSRPLINKLFAKIGKIVATKFRKFRGKLYNKKMYQNYLKNSWFFMLCTKLFWTKKLQTKLLEFNPDVIISTQVGPTGLVAAHKNLFNAKLISVFTDYGLHRMYTIAHDSIDLFCVPTDDIKSQMINIGINKNKIKVTGIPVHSKFVLKDNYDKEKLIAEYDLKRPLFLFVCGGGLGYDNAFAYFEKMLQIDYDFSYIFISGKNEKLLKKAENIASLFNKKGKIFGYVDNMDEFIKISDMVIGKPGGIITSETLNIGVPICAIEPIPGQETNNALFVSDSKFGFYVIDIKGFEILLLNLKNNEVDLEKYKNNIKNKFDKFNFIDI